MGKTQSKRSVDITIEGKKTGEDEITGKLEKIEDVDQRKQGNGEASQDSNEPEKKIDTEEPENDKDLTTEKSADSENLDALIDTNKPTPPEGNGNEEISALTDDCVKKSKKEKVKKKWSFRNISFGRKDKQKPTKSEETTEEIMANGDAENSEPIEKLEAMNTNEAASDVDTIQDTKVTTSETDIIDDKKSPTKKCTEAEIGVSAAICSTVEEVSVQENISDATTEQQTDGKEIAERVEAIASNVINTANNQNGETALNEKVTAITNDNSSADIIKDIKGKEVKKNENDECEDEKPQENGTVEEQQTNSLIEVNTDKASEDSIRSDPTVSNVNKESESVVAVDNDSKQNEIRNEVNLCNYSGENVVQNDSLPPPLPCSPPPSQVSVFAFSHNTESDIPTSQVLNELESTIDESPANAELNHSENYNQNKNENIDEGKTAAIIISNESKEQLFQSTLTPHHLNCIEVESPNVNVEDIDFTKEIEETKADKEKLEKEEIAATVVKEITETAVMLCQQQLKEDENHSNIENIEDNKDKDCIINPSSANSILTNEVKETLTEICKELHMETKTLLGQEDCSVEKIGLLKLSDDELINDSDISKDLSKTDNAPEVTTQELTVLCE